MRTLANGKIDELSIYNRALAPGEIKSIFFAGSSGKSSAGPITSPSLKIAQTNGSIVLSWPVAATGFNLESTAGVGVSNWTATGLTPVTNFAASNVTVTLPSSGTRQYYRLHHP